MTDQVKGFMNADTIKRARDLIEKIKEIENILVISHGLFMLELIDLEMLKKYAIDI